MKRRFTFIKEDENITLEDEEIEKNNNDDIIEEEQMNFDEGNSD